MKDESITTRQQRQAVWARHWATGAAHSCAGSYGQTYGGVIAGFWQTVHAQTPPGSRVLDIATGSGALPRLLLQMRPELDLHIDAVDLAPLAPAWLHELSAEAASRLSFHTGVPAEALPFADGSIDLVVSQYGLEYADLGPAVQELLRVRSPGGRVALVMHHTDSRPVTLAAVEMAHIEWLRGPAGLLAAAEAMLAPMALAATAAGRAALAGNASALAAREGFNAAQDELITRGHTTDGADVLLEIRQAVADVLTLSRQQGVDAARPALLALDEALADAHFRLAELRDCALQETDVAELVRAMQAHALHCRLGTVREGPHLMGWTLVAAPAQA